MSSASNNYRVFGALGQQDWPRSNIVTLWRKETAESYDDQELDTTTVGGLCIPRHDMVSPRRCVRYRTYIDRYQDR